MDAAVQQNNLPDLAGALPPADRETRIRDLRLGRRTVHALLNAGLVTVGDLLDLTQAELRRIPQLGVKSLAEIEVELTRLNLQMAQWKESGARATPCPHPRLDPAYSLKLSAIPAAALRRLESHGIHCRCQLDAMSHAALLRTMEFDNQLTGVVAAECHRHRPPAALSQESSLLLPLDHELWRMTAPAGNELHRRIAMAAFGWDGGGRRTLAEVAQSFGVLLAEVGAICARIDAHWRSGAPPLPSLSAALTLIEKAAPCRAEDAEQIVVQAGLATSVLNAEGLTAAATIAGYEYRLTIIGSDPRLIIPRGSEREFNAVIGVVRRSRRLPEPLTAAEIAAAVRQSAAVIVDLQFVERVAALVAKEMSHP